MLDKFYFFVNSNHNPHHTLALEEYMVENVKKNEVILYLYSHADTVVIGKNQNAWSECRHEKLLADGGTLARRISGGGAVFHDIGNLNFSFIVGKENYDLHRQLSVILAAVKSFGIDAHFSGRNDILAGDRKFSGNAFCFKKEGAFHHGTILIGADMKKLADYLAVPKDKIESKGIASVRSRVVNLCELNKDINADLMTIALKDAFEQEYGKTVPYEMTEEVLCKTQEITNKNATWEWLFGRSPKFDISIKCRFSWGGIELQLSLKDARITEAQLFSDAMDADFISSIAPYLTGVPFHSADIYSAIRQIPHTDEQEIIINDIAAYINEQKY